MRGVAPALQRFAFTFGRLRVIEGVRALKKSIVVRDSCEQSVKRKKPRRLRDRVFYNIWFNNMVKPHDGLVAVG